MVGLSFHNLWYFKNTGTVIGRHIYSTLLVHLSWVIKEGESVLYLRSFSFSWIFLKRRYRKNTDSSLGSLSFDAWVIGEWPRAPWTLGTQTTTNQQAGLQPGGWDLGLPLSKGRGVVFVKGCQTHSFNQKAPRWCLEFDMDRSSLSDRSLSIDCVLTVCWASC